MPTEVNPIYATPRTPTFDACEFYHTIELPGRPTIPGHWDLRKVFDVYTGHVPLDGKSFLDVGTASGFLSFTAESRGASKVLSIDADTNCVLTPIPWSENKSLNIHECLGFTLERVKNSYWFCHNALSSRAVALYRDVHALTPEIGQFDVVIAGCILLHLVDPISALIKIAERCDDTLIITDLDPYDFGDQPVLLPNFCRTRNRTPGDLMSWWQFPPASISLILEVIGFKTISVERFSMQSPLMNQTGRFYSLVARRL